MKFICLGYLDESQWQDLSNERRQQMMDECFDYDDVLRRGGHFVGGEALQGASSAVTLRFKNGAVDVTDGPYAETKEILGGILLLEARDLNHAIALMSQHPGVKAGPFEIRASAEDVNCQIKARAAAVAAETPDRSNGQQSSAVSLASSATATIRTALVTSYEWIMQLANDLADAPLTAPTPKGGNHPLWVIGHLAYSRGALLAMINGQPNPLESWKDLFAGGTEPTGSAGTYPPFSDVKKAYRDIHKATLGLLEEVGESGMDAALAVVPKKLQDMPYFQSKGQVFLFIAMHDMSHRGQLADARHALGRKPFA